MFSIVDPNTGLYPDIEVLRKEPWAKHTVTGSLIFFGIDEDGYLMMCDNCGHYAFVPDNRLEVLKN